MIRDRSITCRGYPVLAAESFVSCSAERFRYLKSNIFPSAAFFGQVPEGRKRKMFENTA
jgi:hypothetical protein